MRKSHLPQPKSFKAMKYQSTINCLEEHMDGKVFEKACHEIVVDILTNYEGFDRLEDANEGEGFNNPPFDFLGFKNNTPFMVEFKGSLKSFNAPGETQKRRLQELLERIDGLHVALLQVKLREGVYRILYDDEMQLLFDGRPYPLDPIEKWIRSFIKTP